MAITPSFLSALTAVSTALYVTYRLTNAWVARSKLKHIPAVGPSDLFGSYISAYTGALSDVRATIQEGYNKYRGRAFKVPFVSKWMVVASSPQMVDDIRKASDDHISFSAAVSEDLQFDYTVGPEILRDPFHVTAVRIPLTRNLAVWFSEVQDEIKCAFNDYVPAEEEWMNVPVFQTSLEIVCRSSNRLFVGLPLCRDPDYKDLNIHAAEGFINSVNAINLFPKFLKPFVAPLVSKVPQNIARAMKHLGPIIEERLAMEAQHGSDWPGKPNDLITWILECGQGRERTVRDLSIRILQINFAAIHTTSMSFTHCVFNLVTYPSYIPLLREEIESVINEEGLSSVSLGKMHKLDSFVKESLRLHGIQGLTSPRKVLKDFTFSDGTHVPEGTTISIPGFALHEDPEYYENPHKFDGFRFYRKREAEGASTKHQIVSLSSDFTVFGCGRHACPGRFFAANEIKAMLVHVLLTYDVKFENEGVRPADHWHGNFVAPDPSATVMFRKRRS